MRHPNFHIPEIDKLEEYKDRLREEFQSKFPTASMTDMQRAYMRDIADFFINELDPYVHFVDQIFKREELEGK